MVRIILEFYKDRFEQCRILSTLFLNKIIEMRAVYAPYCARQSIASGFGFLFLHRFYKVIILQTS